mmetsp:Transcript_57354/g.166524  ORF Transcript_57354/g.166524 Transcript_57354/m.166524 type:complete len:926 (+) Transcript_57354:133-2910(+)
MTDRPDCSAPDSPLACVWQEVRGNVLAVSIASYVASILFLILYVKHQRVRRMPGWVMSRATCCELVSSLSFILLYLAGDPVQLPHPSAMRGHLQLAFTVSIMAAEGAAYTWRLVMYLHLLAIYFNPFSPDRYRILYPVLVVVSAIFSALYCVGILSTAPHGATEEYARAYYSTIVFGLFGYPFIVFVVLGCGLNVAVRVLSCGAQCQARIGQHSMCISSLARQRAMRHSTAYLVIYGVQLAGGLCVTTMLRFGPWRIGPLLRAACVVLSCGRPAISLVCWLVVNDIIYIVFGSCSFYKRGGQRQGRLCCWGWRGAIPAEPLVESADQPAGSTATTTAAAAEMTASATGRRTPAPMYPGAGHSSESVFSVADMRSRASWLPVDLQVRFKDVRELMARRAMELHGIEEVGFKEDLRFELLYDVAHGIGVLAHRELLAPTPMHHLPRLPRTLTAEAPMMRPLRLVRSRSDDRQQGGWPRVDESHAATIPVAASQDEHCPVQHYHMDDFRQVRVAFGISTAAYARTFPSDLSINDPTWRRRLKESVSEGASGSFFYRVLSNSSQRVCRRYIIKQISKREKDALVALLPAYRAYVTARDGRSLIQYFACHSVSLWWKYSGKVYFVVMRDFLPVPQWLTFDLKGAVTNRRALAAGMLHQIHAGEDPRGGAAWGTLRDWEWVDIAMVCDISSEDKDALAEIIAADANFLCAQGMIDYSLLVGIHRLPPKFSPVEREKRLEELKSIGGYASLDRQRVYFFGIIDILESYGFSWRAQRLAARAAYCCICKFAGPDGITAMPPDEYASRFVTFVRTEVLQVDNLPEGNRRGADVLTQLSTFSPTSMSLSEFAARGEPAARGGRARRGLCCIGRAAAFAAEATRTPLTTKERWIRLWQRRRRGLMRERLEVERGDHLRRIADLEAQLADRTLRSGS